MPLQILVAADVVGVGVGIEYPLQLSALLIQYFAQFATGIFVITAVNKPGVDPVRAPDTDFGRAFDIIRFAGKSREFKHIGHLLLLDIF